jgi:hypothetical protein
LPVFLVLLLQTTRAMTKLLIPIILLALSAFYSKAQPARVEPFADAVPYSMKSASNVYFTNQDAASVKAFFEEQTGVMPEKIIRVDEGYYHGFRICYSNSICTDADKISSWIQVLTINTEECFEWFEQTNPEFLMIPFVGIKETARKNRQLQDDFNKIYDQYKYLACRLYRLSEGSDGQESDELSLVLQKYSERVNNQTDQMLASGDNNSYVKPRNAGSDQQNLWVQCLEELSLVGYITLIEYSDPPGSGSLW